MLSLLAPTASRLCDGLSRREVLRVGGLSALGLSLPDLLQARASEKPGVGKAKSCIVLFLMGGPPQHSTWDPKPDAPAEIRGEFGPIDTNVPGIRFGSLLPRLARHADKLCVLRAMSTGDNAHSSSGYYMLTGVPHSPMNVENANPGAPNDWPNIAAIVRRLRGDSQWPAVGRAPADAHLQHRRRSGRARTRASSAARPIRGSSAASRARRTSASPSSRSPRMSRWIASASAATCSSNSTARSPTSARRATRSRRDRFRHSTC